MTTLSKKALMTQSESQKVLTVSLHCDSNALDNISMI